MPNPKRGASLSNYKLLETEEFTERIEEFSIVEKSFLQRKLKSYVYPQVKLEPHYGLNIKRLIDYVPLTWRYRIGKFRVFYSIDEKLKVVSILTIDFRKDAYK